MIRKRTQTMKPYKIIAEVTARSTNNILLFWAEEY
jgi:hypothetical protein